jgi:serine/threonine protein kinase
MSDEQSETAHASSLDISGARGAPTGGPAPAICFAAVDPISELENALGAELLRAAMLRAFPPSIGKRYVVEKFLGRGASGLVVAARDDRLDRPVALKLRPVGGDVQMLAEARALAKLDHPNVVRVHDVDVVEASFNRRPFRLWMVSMQRVTGRTLRTWLAEKQRSRDEIIEIFLAAGRALEAAHAEKIVHRDFKPDNVLVRSDGVAQVIDFGFAVPALSSRVDGASLGFGVAGTDAYMAPEAREGRPTAKSDQYSFAVSLVEALTGAPTKPGFFRPGTISRPTWRVLRRATRASTARYPSMTSMLRELDASRRPSVFWSRVRRAAFAATIVGVLGYWATANPDIVLDLASRLARGFQAAVGPGLGEPMSAPTSLSMTSTASHDEADASVDDPLAVPPQTPGASDAQMDVTPADTRSASCAGLSDRPLELRTRADGYVGCWRVTLSDPPTCEARFEKYASSESCDLLTEDVPERVATVRLERGEDGAHATVPVLGRVYRFHFPDAPASFAGSVEIESDGEIQTGRVSHLGPLAGRDARRTE